MAKSKTETQAAQRKTAFHIDANGRRIEVCALNALEYYELAKALGTVSSEAANDMAAVVATVRKIDTTHYAMPSSEADVRFLIQTLDFAGIAAAGVALAKLGQTEKDVQKEVDAAKN